MHISEVGIDAWEKFIIFEIITVILLKKIVKSFTFPKNSL